MAWDYNYRIDGQQLSDYALNTRVAQERKAPKRARNIVQPHAHGVAHIARPFYESWVIPLETLLRYTDDAGDVTHTNGEAGHVFENYKSIGALLSGRSATPPRLERNDPDKGEVEIPVANRAGASPGRPRHYISWPLLTLDPFWASATLKSQSDPVGSGITTLGDAPVNESLIITFTGGSDPRLTNLTNGDYLEIDDASMSNPVVITIGVGTKTVVQNSNNVRGKLIRNRPWWFELEPGANTFSLTGGGSCTVQYRDKWE